MKKLMVTALLLIFPLIAFAADEDQMNQPTTRPDQLQKKDQTFPFAPKPGDIKSRSPEATETPDIGVGGGEGPIDEQQPTPVEVSDLLGAKVSDKDGQSIGKIHSLILGSKGRISHVIISVGGFMGIGSRYYAVPWRVVNFNPSTLSGPRPWDQVISLHATKDRVLGAPRVGRRLVDSSKVSATQPGRETTPLSQSDEYFRNNVRADAGK